MKVECGVLQDCLEAKGTNVPDGQNRGPVPASRNRNRRKNLGRRGAAPWRST